MKRIHEFCKRLFVRRPGWVAGITVLDALSLMIIFYAGLEKHPATSMLYAFSSYVLVVLGVFTIRKGRKFVCRISQTAFCRRWQKEPLFRTSVSMGCAFVLHSLYVAVYFATGVVYQSCWIKACAGYYAVLIAARFFLLISMKKPLRSALRRYCVCGCLLCVLTVPLGAMVFQLMLGAQGISYPKELVYAAALYAFYSFGAAAFNCIRFRCLENPILSAAKAVSFAVAMVAMLSLQTLMFTTFGGTESFHRKMNFATGSAVCVCVLGMGATMVRRGWKELHHPHFEKEKKEKNMKSNESFQYCYSAKQQTELEKIRERYLPQKEDPMNRVRELDRSVARRGSLVGLSTGILGTLFLGIGMSCTMVWADTLFSLGVGVGLVGIAIIALAYPLSRMAAEKQRKKVADEILRLTEELMQ